MFTYSVESAEKCAENWKMSEMPALDLEPDLKTFKFKKTLAFIKNTWYNS